jgi:putative DNA primase/helicase
VEAARQANASVILAKPLTAAALPPDFPARYSKCVYPLTDAGNAERIVTWYKDRVRFIPSWYRYLIYDGVRWKQDVGGAGMTELALRVARGIQEESKRAALASLGKTVRAWGKRSESSARVKGAIEMVRGMKGVALEHTELDKDPWMLQCSNGVVDLRTGAITGQSQGCFITKSTRIAYDPDAKAPLWESFLEMVVPDVDTRGFLQRLAGYCLTGEVSERVLTILHGYGRNGKSLFLRVLQDMLGDYATTAMPSLLMAKDHEGHPAEIAHLFRIRLAVASEVKKNRAFDEEAVKRLTGNDVITARGMRENPWSFEPQFKLLIAVNHKPRVRDSSDSIWDRILIVNFGRRIEDHEVDRRLLDKLKRELPGILAWAVEGCLAWQKDGLQIPEGVRAATKAYRRAEDIVGRFLEDCCCFGRTIKTTAKELEATVATWCKSQGFQYVLSRQAVADRLNEKGCETKRAAAGYVWYGLAIKEEYRKEIGLSTLPSRATPAAIGRSVLGPRKAPKK